MDTSSARSKRANPRVRTGLSTARLAGLAVLAMTITAMHGTKSDPGIRDIGPSGQATALETTPQYERDPTKLLDAYRHVEVASVSDAIEQLL